MTNFWAAQMRTAAAPVIEETAGDQETIPYNIMLGTAIGGTDAVELGEAAERLYPTLNATENHLPASQRPAAFNMAPNELTSEEFLSWHSAYQLEYVNKNAPTHPQSSLTIGSGSLQITVLISHNNLDLYVVEHLQKRDLTLMPLADQQAIAILPAFGAVAQRLGLTPIGAERPSDVNAARSEMIALALAKATALSELTLEAYGENQERLPIADEQVFQDEILLIQSRIERMAIFDAREIGSQLNDIETRYRRAYAYYNAPNESEATQTTSNVASYGGVVSLDDKASISRAYTVFIEQEKRILGLAQQRNNLVAVPELQNKRLDVPTIIFLIQLYYNISAEAKIVADTEAMNQQNELQKTYARMQLYVNQTLKLFDPASSDQQLAFLNKTYDELTEEERKILSMFETEFGTGVHPLEALNNLERPTHDMIDNNDGTNRQFKKSAWDTFATQISDTVTLINQETQIKMNDINSLDKQKNRHFELASSAVSKLYEILQSIARA